MASVGLKFGATGATAGNGIVNLLGGTITTNQVQSSATSAIFNFNGGTLKAGNTPVTAFMTGLTNAYVYSGGGTIDNGGSSITISQALLAPTGSGVSSTGLLITGGSGYIDTPVVTLSGGAGTGATAVATVSGGVVSGITITNPGVGYTSVPTFTLTGGGGSGASVATGTAVIAANTSGGLTFQSAGTTTLSGANTYTGGTTLTSGTLQAGNVAAFGTGGMTVNGGTLDLNTNAISVASLSGTGGIVTDNGASGTTTLTVNGSTSTSYAGAINNGALRTVALLKNGTSTLTLSGTSNTYSGVTTIAGGVLNAASFSNYGANSSLGNRANSDSSGNVGLLFQGGTLQYTGSTAQSTNRAIRLSTTGGGGTIDASGSVAAATLSFTATSSPDFFENSGSRTLTLTGTNTGNNTFGMAIVETGGTTSLVKNGAGTWVVNGAGVYSGGTTINAGTLNSGARGLGSGAVSVGSSGTLSVAQANNVGLAAQYFNITPAGSTSNANFNTLQALQGHLAGSGQPALANTATTMNFGASGGSFPSPYNSGGANFESYYSGKINIAAAGTYTFNTSSDDGSVLWIDGNLVVNNNFFQGVTTRTGSLSLTTGYHNIVVGYYQGGGGYGMNAQISGANNTTMVDITNTNSNAQLTPDLVIGSLAGSGAVALTTGNLIAGGNNTSTSFSGVISGIGDVNKWGTGTLTLSGANNYTGTTAISAGHLIIDTGVGNALSYSGAFTSFAAGGGIPLQVNGTGSLTLSGALTLNGNSNDTNNPALFMNNNSTTVSLTGTGTLTGISTGWTGTKNTLNFASTGTITLSNTDTSLDVGQLGGSGVVNQTTGTVAVAGNISLGKWDSSYGNYNLSGGVLNAVNIRSGGNGTSTATRSFCKRPARPISAAPPSSARITPARTSWTSPRLGLTTRPPAASRSPTEPPGSASSPFGAEA